MNSDTEQITSMLKNINNSVNSENLIDSDRFNNIILSDLGNKQKKIPINPLTSSESSYISNHKKSNNAIKKYDFSQNDYSKSDYSVNNYSEIDHKENYNTNNSDNDIESSPEEYTPVIEPSTISSIYPDSDIFRSSQQFSLNNISNIQNDKFPSNKKPKYKLYSEKSSEDNNSKKYDIHKVNNAHNNNNYSNNSETNYYNSDSDYSLSNKIKNYKLKNL